MSVPASNPNPTPDPMTQNDLRLMGNAYQQQQDMAHRLDRAITQLKRIVEIEGQDAGVILLSHDSPCHSEPDPTDTNQPPRQISVYNHEYFSPLGDALIHLHRILIGQE
jgi:hypothetical protein